MGAEATKKPPMTQSNGGLVLLFSLPLPAVDAAG